MKTGKIILSLLLTATLILGVFGLSAAAEDAAEEYTYLCVRLSAEFLESVLETGRELQPVRDRYVDMDTYAGSYVRLDPDGTGYLYLGEDNQGPITRWSRDGEALTFDAGVSRFDAVIEDGLMTLDMDGFQVCFAAAGADTSGIKMISVSAFSQIVYGQVEGEYTLFALGNGTEIRDAAGGFDSAMVLSGDGTGTLTFDGDTVNITSWSLDGNTISVTLDDGESTTGILRRETGAVELNISGYTGYYGQEGADTAWYLEPDSLLFALFSSLDPNAGLHLRYSLHTDYLDSDSDYDVHTRDGVYYSARTTRVSGHEQTTVTFFRDGTAYTLNPAAMTGSVATTTSSSLLSGNILLMDGLYSAIYTHAGAVGYTEEARELDGVSCTVEVYPATEYKPEIAFYFAPDGSLLRVVEGPPVVETAAEIGESVYTVLGMDTSVDDALFDISAYQISG